MSIERPHARPHPIPKEHRLPLAIQESEVFDKQGHDVAVWRVTIVDTENTPLDVLLKQTRTPEQTTLASTLETMKQGKLFYEFLKTFPRFASFVPDTTFFIAQQTEDDQPRGYRMQRFIENARQISEISDTELQQDPAVVTELIELIDASIEVFEEAIKWGMPVPDYYGKSVVANFVRDPRHTSNIIVTPTPDTDNHRVHFVDVGENIPMASGIRKQLSGLSSRLQLTQLRRWKHQLEQWTT